jgi:signal transduction histidine kinase
MTSIEEALFTALEDERRLSEERALLPGILQHDLANVLCQVSLSASILTAARDEVERARSLRDLQGGVKRMSELLSGMRLLFLTRGGATDFARGDLAAFIAELVREVGVWPEGAPITLDLPEEVVVPFSPLLLRHALVNLIGNAVAYSRGTWVRVRLSRASGATWHLSVANGGPGIPIDHRPYLFELVSAGKAATKIGSSGLGLYIARMCVRFHGSTLRVRSRDKLTVFSFHVRDAQHDLAAKESGGETMFAA